MLDGAKAVVASLSLSGILVEVEWLGGNAHRVVTYWSEGQETLTVPRLAEAFAEVARLAVRIDARVEGDLTAYVLP